MQTRTRLIHGVAIVSVLALLALEAPAAAVSAQPEASSTETSNGTEA